MVQLPSENHLFPQLPLSPIPVSQKFCLCSDPVLPPLSLPAIPTASHGLPLRHHPVLQRMNSVFSFDEFTSGSVLPISLGFVQDKDTFSSRTSTEIRILDTPVKFPHSDYRIPAQFSQFSEVFAAIVGYEAKVNPLVDKLYCYVMKKIPFLCCTPERRLHLLHVFQLTIDQGWVDAGVTQRNPGCHVDGFQGARVWPKVVAEHSYTVSDCVPTVFYPQPFRIEGLNPEVDDFFGHFDQQANESRAHRLTPYEIALFDWSVKSP